MTDPNAPTPDELWRQYALHVDLYKFYLDVVIRFNILYYAITGAILSFHFSRVQATPLVKYSLLFPTIISVAFGTLFVYGARLVTVTRDEVFDIAQKLGFHTAPEFRVLQVVLWLFALLFFLVAASLLWLVFGNGLDA